MSVLSPSREGDLSPAPFFSDGIRTRHFDDASAVTKAPSGRFQGQPALRRQRRVQGCPREEANTTAYEVSWRRDRPAFRLPPSPQKKSDLSSRCLFLPHSWATGLGICMGSDGCQAGQCWWCAVRRDQTFPASFFPNRSLPLSQSVHLLACKDAWRMPAASSQFSSLSFCGPSGERR